MSYGYWPKVNVIAQMESKLTAQDFSPLAMKTHPFLQ